METGSEIERFNADACGIGLELPRYCGLMDSQAIREDLVANTSKPMFPDANF